MAHTNSNPDVLQICKYSCSAEEDDSEVRPIVDQIMTEICTGNNSTDNNNMIGNLVSPKSVKCVIIGGGQPCCSLPFALPNRFCTRSATAPGRLRCLQPLRGHYLAHRTRRNCIQTPPNSQSRLLRSETVKWGHNFPADPISAPPVAVYRSLTPTPVRNALGAKLWTHQSKLKKQTHLDTELIRRAESAECGKFEIKRKTEFLLKPTPHHMQMFYLDSGRPVTVLKASKERKPLLPSPMPSSQMLLRVPVVAIKPNQMFAHKPLAKGSDEFVDVLKREMWRIEDVKTGSFSIEEYVDYRWKGGPKPSIECSVSSVASS